MEERGRDRDQGVGEHAYAQLEGKEWLGAPKADMDYPTMNILSNAVN
jgi:hypothetical protein